MNTPLTLLLLVVVVMGTVTETAQQPFKRDLQHPGCVCVTSPCNCGGQQQQRRPSPPSFLPDVRGCITLPCFYPPCPCV
ncbi:hypothetical protein Pmani_020128 [Petrolisthes manimaculis]|uniref:Uncharacterized protein n=1 Tax=Petrolisthes manimaculis TaxID=1843537 RepID=A0AAE1PGB7_9EUCA|nr:hypothetical protein Pmani_020128 [Petrolisthes manimaculis]